MKIWILVYVIWVFKRLILKLDSIKEYNNEFMYIKCDRMKYEYNEPSQVKW